MTKEEQQKLIELGKSIELTFKVTLFELKGKLGVCYLDFEVFEYATAFRDLMNIKAQKESRI